MNLLDAMGVETRLIASLPGILLTGILLTINRVSTGIILTGILLTINRVSAVATIGKTQHIVFVLCSLKILFYVYPSDLIYVR